MYAVRALSSRSLNPIASVSFDRYQEVTIKGNARHDVTGDLRIRPLNDVLVFTTNQY